MMKYIGGGANIITVDYKGYNGFEFGETSKKYVFSNSIKYISNVIIVCFIRI